MLIFCHAVQRNYEESHSISRTVRNLEFWFSQLFAANWPIACTTWEPDITYWFWVYLRTLAAGRSSVVTFRPAPHPHCSKSRFSSWDEVKMRCCFTTLVLIKKKAANFFFFFAIFFPSFGCGRQHAEQQVSLSGIYSLPSNYIIKAPLFLSGATDRRRVCLPGIICSLCRWEDFIYTFLVVPAAVYSGISFMSTISHGCHCH